MHGIKNLQVADAVELQNEPSSFNNVSSFKNNGAFFNNRIMKIDKISRNMVITGASGWLGKRLAVL